MRNHYGQFVCKNWLKRNLKFTGAIDSRTVVACLGVAIVLAISFDSVREQEVHIVPTVYAEEIERREVRIKVVYSQEGVERLIRETFKETPGLAVAIAKAESGKNLKQDAYNPESHNGCNGSYGVFQIACVHESDPEKLYDVEYNIERAYELYKQHGWSIWGGFTSDGYKKHL